MKGLARGLFNIQIGDISGCLKGADGMKREVYAALNGFKGKNPKAINNGIHAIVKMMKNLPNHLSKCNAISQ